MEGQTQFQTALKKTVIMFKTITGKDLSEREASLLINLLDLTDGYLSANAPKDDNSEAKALVKLVEQAVIAEPAQQKATGIDAASSDEPYVAQPITTSERDHIQGYDWQIVVLSREKDPRDSYVVHFAYQPTQEQFEEHFAKFVDRTHYVHVNEWHRHEREWVGITTRYAECVTQPFKQDHDPRWEQDDMAYRVRYYDRETGQLTFKYMPRKPSGNELATYHHLKGFAVVQSKVA